MGDLKGKDFFASWSGGKDSCLALYRAIRQGGRPRRLLTMFGDDGEKSKSHALSREIIQAQADALGIPVEIGSASWDDYEARFLEHLAGLKADGLGDGVFGDIDLLPHRQWVEKVCDKHGITPHLPLWQEERRKLVGEFIEAGFVAMIVVVEDKRLDRSFLGRRIDWPTIEALEAAGADACGEEGEYHSLVIDGPLFSSALNLQTGAIVGHGGYSFLETALETEKKN
ncbi:MAG: diphthine--ammonia ligase [Proteobacteria bacterium]|nr:diphthine--ammonia ligase [Pseudomonadota bacterium]MBU1738577.1 diphthine--ammonia ligase [Pseudomonadota bacterium]